MMKNLTMPQAAMVVGVLFCVCYVFSNWPDQYIYRESAPRWRVDTYSGRVQYRDQIEHHWADR